MLNKLDVEQEEEHLREQVNQLSNLDRKAFYQEVRHKLKDPDTYAALNWFFIAGLHHFYLGRWFNGLADLAVFAAGVMLVIKQYMFLGLALIIAVSAWELWALFRSQIIVQDWNNKLYRDVLQRYGEKRYGENRKEVLDPSMKKN